MFASEFQVATIEKQSCVASNASITHHQKSSLLFPICKTSEKISEEPGGRGRARGRYCLLAVSFGSDLCMLFRWKFLQAAKLQHVVRVAKP